VALDNRRVLGVMLAIAGIGVTVSAWLVYLQVAVIGSICFWCVLSALTMLSILAMSLSAFLMKRAPQRSELANPPRMMHVPSGALPPPFRFPLMALGMIALLAAMLGGLFRLGWDWPIVPPALRAAHGPLMISGFLGTLIGLERTVAMGKWWPSVGPLCTGIGALLLIAGVPGVAGPTLITLGSLVLVITFVQLIRGQPALFTVTMGLGALAWLVGNTLWLVGWPIYRVVSWWAAFLILTIAGERLELSRFLPLARRHRLSFLAAIGVFVAGLLLAVVAFDGGSRMSGLGLIAMSIWLLRHDMARQSVQKTGLHRFVALSLLVGYVWLAVAGLLMLSLGGVATGVHHAAALHVHEHGVQDGYDAALHAIFVGFAFSMIIGHAPIIFPSVLGISLPFRSAFYSHLVLLHLSLVLRVVGDLAAWWPWRLGGGLLNAVAVLLFLGNMALSGAMGKQSVSLQVDRLKAEGF
jgi:hypothetical protein